MAGYLTRAEFLARSIMPTHTADELEIAEPGWILAQLDIKSRWIDARLRKRYAAPFASPYPECVQDWLTRIVTWRAYMKIGVNPTDEQTADIFKDGQQAEKEVQEAADSVSSLFDLPLRADTTTEGTSRGGPVVYAEVSPYTWTNLQKEAVEANGE